MNMWRARHDHNPTKSHQLKAKDWEGKPETHLYDATGEACGDIVIRMGKVGARREEKVRHRRALSCFGRTSRWRAPNGMPHISSSDFLRALMLLVLTAFFNLLALKTYGKCSPSMSN